jgi:hypothetical protein
MLVVVYRCFFTVRGRASPHEFSLKGSWQAKVLQYMKFNNFTTTPHNTRKTEEQRRHSSVDKVKHQLEGRPVIVDRSHHWNNILVKDTHNHWALHTTPHSYAAPLSLAIWGSSQWRWGLKAAGVIPTKAQWKQQNFLSMLMGPPFKAHSGCHTPTSNVVRGEETSQGNGGRVETPT